MKIAGLGDIMLGDQPFCFGFGIRSKYKQGKTIFKNEIPEYLARFDLVIANLESPLCDIRDQENDDIGFFAMRGDTHTSKILVDLGINAVNVANNHILEHGSDAFQKTLDELDRRGIIHFGSHRKSNHLFTHNNLKIALLGWSMVQENYLGEISSSSLYNLTSDHQEILDEVNSIRDDVDRVILNLHWGSEFMEQPSIQQTKIAEDLLSSGVDVIIGHHPHVLQPIEKKNGGIVAYSMGNFIFDYWMRNTNKSGIIEIDLVKMEFEFNSCSIDVRTFQTRLSTKEQYLPERCAETTNLTLDLYNQKVVKMRKVYRRNALLHFFRNVFRYQKRSLLKLIKWGFKRLVFIFRIRKLEQKNPGIVYMGPSK